MKTATVIGILLIIIGLISLAFSGVSFKHRRCSKQAPSAPRKAAGNVCLCLRFQASLPWGGMVLIAAGARAR